MQSSKSSDDRIAQMTFKAVYPHYLAKVTRKGRTEEELTAVIKWLTGFSNDELHRHIAEETSFEGFFAACDLNPRAELITGSICGHRIEEIENPLTKKVRYLDKLVDELAKGRKLEKILRTSS